MSDVDLVLTVGSQAYRSWKAVAVSRGIEQLAGSFQLQCADRWALAGQTLPQLVGQSCTVAIGSTVIITGYIDATEASYGPEQHDLVIRGRDATADLVDCAAITDGQGADQTSLLRIAQALCAPHQVHVSLDGPQDTPFRSGRISPGETVADVLSRAAAIAGCLLVSDGRGGLVMTRAGSGRARTPLRHRVNILSASASEDASQRYARYDIVGQTSEAGTDLSALSQQVLASSTDRGVRPSRVAVVQVSDSIDGDQAQQMANWVAASALARGLRADITVRGWLDGDRPWAPNTLVNVVDPWLRLDGDYLIAAVQHRLDDRAGQTSVLSITPPAAYVPAPVVGEDAA